MVNRLWLPQPANLILSSDEVHVWRASLDLPSSHLNQLRRMLSADELERANRFHFEKDRRHYIAGRGILRDILGRYLNIAPDQLGFYYNDHGKPALIPAPGQKPLRFNLSHSAGMALYAMAHAREVGVDLERIRDDLKHEEIAQRFFSPQENSILRALPAKAKIEAFFNCWTRKEAYIKARGQGLSLPLDQFDVSLAPGEAAALLKVKGNPQEAGRWSLWALSPDPNFVAALAIQGHYQQLSYWQWP